MYQIMIFVWFLISTVYGNHMPESIKPFRCKLGPDLEECSVKNGNQVIQQIVGGIPELHIPSLNPMEIESLKLIDTPTLHINLTNIKIHGLTDIKVIKTKADMEKGVIQSDLEGKNITIEGMYTADGKISVMPIKGSGHFSLFLKNGVYKPSIHIEYVDIDGLKHMKRQKLEMGYEFEGITFNFENLFEGNPQLSEETNKFLNENWKDLLTEFGPGLVDILIGILNDLFDEFAAVPFNEYFLSD